MGEFPGGQDGESCCAAAAFSPADASTLFVADASGGLRSLDLARAAVTWHSSPHACAAVGVGCDRDGGSVLTASRDGTLAVTSADTGECGRLSQDLRGCLRGAALDCIALTAPTPTLIAAAWRNGFVVATVPWEDVPVQVVADFCAPRAADGEVCPRQ